MNSQNRTGENLEPSLKPDFSQKPLPNMELASLISQYSPINSEAKIELLLSELINSKLFNLQNKVKIHLHIKKRKSQEYFFNSWDKFEKKLLHKRPFHPSSALHHCPGCKTVLKEREIRYHRRRCYPFEQYVTRKLCESSDFYQKFLKNQIVDGNKILTTQKIRNQKRDTQPAIRRVAPLSYYTSENDEDILHQ